MLSRQQLAVAVTSALLVAGLFSAGAQAAPPYGQVSFSEPTLFPRFGPHAHDYVVRCHNGPVTVHAHAAGAWRLAIGDHPYRRGDFSRTAPLSKGRAFTVTAKRSRPAEVSRYHVRCLPDNFPRYSFTRYGPVSPKYFTANQERVPYKRRYAIIFDNRGVPIWWYHAPARDPRVLGDGNVLWFNRWSERFEIHRFDGSRLRRLDAVGQQANPHDLQLVGDGGHLVGAYVRQRHVDTSAYGGSSDADVLNAELQQVSPAGDLVWDWKSQDHMSLDETGRWWGWAINNPNLPDYDILHWNSIEPAGNAVIASFRHLDAVYKIRKGTGSIVWKLGGTTTPQSLTVKRDPRGHTFGGQHDARLLPNGTLTVFDNRSQLADKAPRAVRYRIDQQRGTATLLESITDPDVAVSNCCGSARRLGNGDWLIGWGQNNPIGGYRPDGRRTFLLTLDSNYSYRAEPVAEGAASARDLRRGMNAMYGAP